MSAAVGDWYMRDMGSYIYYRKVIEIGIEHRYRDNLLPEMATPTVKTLIIVMDTKGEITWLPIIRPGVYVPIDKTSVETFSNHYLATNYTKITDEVEIAMLELVLL